MYAAILNSFVHSLRSRFRARCVFDVFATLAFTLVCQDRETILTAHFLQCVHKACNLTASKKIVVINYDVLIFIRVELHLPYVAHSSSAKGVTI